MLRSSEQKVSDAIQVRPRVADGCRMRQACAGGGSERRARFLHQDARFLDHGGKSVCVPGHPRRARPAGPTAASSGALHPLSREPQPGAAPGKPSGSAPLIPRIDGRSRGRRISGVAPHERSEMRDGSPMSLADFLRSPELQAPCVMPGLVAGIHRKKVSIQDGIAGSSPAMTAVRLQHYTASRSLTAPSRSTETS